MGRKRKYEGLDEKERTRARVKACRDRQKLKGVEVDVAIGKISRAQSRFEGRKKFERKDYKQLSCNEIVYLCKRVESNMYAIFLRSYDPTSEKTSVTFKDKLQQSEATQEYNNVIGDTRKPFWFGFYSMRAKVVEFLKAYSDGKEKDLLWGNEYYSFRFIAMLNEVVEVQGEGELRKLKKNVAESTESGRHLGRRELVSFFPDLVFKKGQNREEVKKIIESSISLIIEKTLAMNRNSVKLASCKKKVDLFQDVLKIMLEFPRVYDEFFPEKMVSVISESKIKILDSFKKKRNVEIGLADSDNNPFIPLDHLKIILDEAWRTSSSLYYFIVLTLSVGGREEEMRRLVAHPKSFVLSDGTLDYNNSRRRKNIVEYLIQKTADRDISGLTNPRLSIISRMILFYENPMPVPTLFFRDKKKGFRSNPELVDYHERCLRTTCATMLAYCTKLRGYGKSIYSDVQVRLGHSDLSMAMKIYAKKLPSDSSPIKYFSIAPSTIVGKVDITANSNLWDTWLLKDYLSRKKTCFTSENTELLKQFNSNLLKEAKFFNDHMDEDPEVDNTKDDLDWMCTGDVA